MHDLPGFGVWISGGVDEDGELLVSGLMLVIVVRWMYLLLFSGHYGVLAIVAWQV